jgi:hypothetical protein
MYCLARDCARDEVVRKFVEPALELVMLDKALRGKFDREKALLRFGEMYATALAGNGTVGPSKVVLVVGRELGGGAAPLRLATLQLLNQLLSDELKFGVRIYVVEGTYRITATGENAARLKRLLAVSAPSAGGKYLSDKFNEFVKEARAEVRVDNIRLTKRNVAAADLTISVCGVAVKYNVISERQGRAPIRVDRPEPRGACGPHAEACGRQRGGEESGRWKRLAHQSLRRHACGRMRGA